MARPSIVISERPVGLNDVSGHRDLQVLLQVINVSSRAFGANTPLPSVAILIVEIRDDVDGLMVAAARPA